MKKVYILHSKKKDIQNNLDKDTHWKKIQENKYYKIYYRNNMEQEIFIIKPIKKHKILVKILRNLIRDILKEDIIIKEIF